MRILITAGPTREMIDDVRFISNLASGLLGILIAGQSASREDDVTLILGPTHLSPEKSDNLEVVRVVSALEMYAAVEKRFADCDVFISTAAVADYRPKEKIDGKFKKDGGNWEIELVRNPDILKEMGKRKRKQILIGFALEAGQNRDSDFGIRDSGKTPEGRITNHEARTTNHESRIINAKKKLLEKNCDMLVLNSPQNLGEESEDSLFFITSKGIERKFKNIDKQTQATQILNFLKDKI